MLVQPDEEDAGTQLRREAIVQLVGEHGDVHDLLQTLDGCHGDRAKEG